MTINSPKNLTIALLTFACILTADMNDKPFPNKLIFAETPEIGRKWRGGIRSNDIIMWDMYLNIHDWLTLDILLAGFKNLGDDSLRFTDHFRIVTLKSRPLFRKKLHEGEYSVSAGLKIYTDTTALETPTDSLAFGRSSTPLFLTQRYFWKQKHYFNLFSSFSFKKKKTPTIYIASGYKLLLSQRWRFAAEYYLTNTQNLPGKTLQFFLDPDHLEFDNRARDWYSFMVWGFSYSRKHILFNLYLANHISFQGPIIPFFGLGWNF